MSLEVAVMAMEQGAQVSFDQAILIIVSSNYQI